MLQRLTAAVNVLLLTAITLRTASSLPLASFAGFGSNAGDLSLPRGDDEIARVNLSINLQFFNTSYSHVYVSVFCFLFITKWHE